MGTTSSLRDGKQQPRHKKGRGIDAREPTKRGINQAAVRYFCCVGLMIDKSVEEAGATNAYKKTRLEKLTRNKTEELGQAVRCLLHDGGQSIQKGMKR